MSITKIMYIGRNIGRKRGSLTNIPAVASESTQGSVSKISIDDIIAIAPAALLGNALSIA